MQRWMRFLACLLVLMLLPAACAQVQYQPRSGLTTILLAGTDRRPSHEIDPLDFRNGGQADFLLLLVLDGENNTITPVHIDRDTITRITTLSVLGRVSGSRRSQICLAHSFGDGEAYSAELLSDAVSNLLGGIPVDYYFTMSMYAVPNLNDAIGGVQVTLTENDDFSYYDDEMTPGKTLTLTGRQAFYYTTRRYYVGDSSNAARQQRQRTYILAALEQLSGEMQRNPGVMSDLLTLAQEHITTNLTFGDLLPLALGALKSEINPIQTLPGTHQVGSNGFVEFIVDEPALAQLIQDIFYEPAN